MNITILQDENRKLGYESEQCESEKHLSESKSLEDTELGFNKSFVPLERDNTGNSLIIPNRGLLKNESNTP